MSFLNFPYMKSLYHCGKLGNLKIAVTGLKRLLLNLTATAKHFFKN